MEDGKDTQEVLEDYVRMKYLVDEVEGKIEKNKLKYTDEIAKVKEKLKETQQQLKKQHYEVTVPLMEEAKRQQAEIGKLNDKIQYQLD